MQGPFESVTDETGTLLDTLFFSAPVALGFFDDELRFVRVNDALADINGIPAEAHLGRTIEEVLPEMDPAVMDHLRRVVRTGEPLVAVEVAGRTPAAPGENRVWQVSYYPVHDRARTIIGVGAVVVEMTDRVRLLESERAARERAERAERRAAFLARAGEALGASLDYEETLGRLARLAVPAKADLCAIDVRDDFGRLRRLAVHHVDPARTALGREVFERWPPAGDEPEGVAWVLRTGRPLLHREVTDELLERIAHDGEHLEALRALGIRSEMVVPLRARGQVVGAITFALSQTAGAYGDDDLALAMEVARRASTAIENASLHRQVEYIARTLQASLLPPRLPEIPGFEVAGRYRAAGEGFDVGGDFYDAFPRDEHSWAIVLGDVVGKGPEAAALTALARYTTRAAAFDHREPRQALALLNEAVLREDGGGRYMTAVQATLDLGGSGAALKLASAGHPPALLLRDGVGRALTGGGRLLGVDPDLRVEETSLALRPGDVVVLYTDGVTDAGAPARILTVDDLLATLEGAAGESAEGVAAALERKALHGAQGLPRDDIAIVTLRYVG